jgi:hypothetical protein
VEASRLDETAGHVGSIATLPQKKLQTPIRATLTGSRRCEAEGKSACSSAPVLALCRLLVAAGREPTTPLEAYRDDVLALRVRSIGEGARLTVEDGRHGSPRFRQWRDRGGGAGSAVTQPEQGHGERQTRRSKRTPGGGP